MLWLKEVLWWKTLAEGGALVEGGTLVEGDLAGGGALAEGGALAGEVPLNAASKASAKLLMRACLVAFSGRNDGSWF